MDPETTFAWADCNVELLFYVTKIAFAAWALLILVAIRFQIFSVFSGFYHFVFSSTHDFSIRDNCQSRSSLASFLLWYIPTHWFRRSPDVYVFGASKCGTSFLIDTIRSHPEIYLSNLCKETQYFIGLSPFCCFFEKFDNLYRSFFPTIFTYLYNPRSVVVEGTVSYLLWNEVFGGDIVKRIQKLNPNAKFIIILREPTARTHSHFQMLKNNKSGKNYERRSIGKAVRSEIESEAIFELRNQCRRAKSMSPVFAQMGLTHTIDDANEFIKFRYLRSSYYHKQMKMLKRDVAAENIFVYKFDDMVQDPNACIGKIFDFLGVGQFEVKMGKKNKTIRKAGENGLKPGVRKFLQNTLENDITFYDALRNGSKQC